MSTSAEIGREWVARAQANQQRIRDAVRTIVGTHTYEVDPASNCPHSVAVDDEDALVEDLVALIHSERSDAVRGA